MSINEIIIYIMVAFMVLGAIDKCLGNKFGLGEQFEEGMMAMGSLALAMIGVICLAPVLATVLKPVVVPVFNALGADPAMFAGSILANDMGGAPLAAELALDPQAGLFGGLIVGAMMGPTIVFTIPVALGIIKILQDEKYTIALKKTASKKGANYNLATYYNNFLKGIELDGENN